MPAFGFLLWWGGDAPPPISAPLDPSPRLAGPQGQQRTFELQVWRNGNWVSIPVASATGSIGKNRGGQLKVKIPDNLQDVARSRLYEGEKVRAFRGVAGTQTTRCWTGYVDAPTALDAMGISRELQITDYVKELNDAILTAGVVYDTFRPNKAAADAIQRALDTQQFKPTDDLGNPISTTAGFFLPNGNQLCYFPDLINPDGTTFALASGQLGSFTQGGMGPAYATLTIPAPQVGVNAKYVAFLLPNQYLIASTMVMHSPFSLVIDPENFPPNPHKVMVDYYNGVMYFNPTDASSTVSFSCFYYSSPLYAYPAGTKISDVVAEILTKTGFRWYVDAYGKFQAIYVDTNKPLKKVFNRGQYISNGVQTNRDRRNVILCEGWDGVKSTLIVSKAINREDLNNPPPIGLGKRSYMVAQDRTWLSQQVVNRAAYFAIQQLGRRGKVASMQIVDDPTLKLEDVIAFAGVMPEVGDGDLFYVEQIDWAYTLDKGGKIDAKSTVTGTMLPGQGTFMVGPPQGTTVEGQYDFTQDVVVFDRASLSPAGGKYWSTFSIASRPSPLNLQYYCYFSGVETIDLWGADGHHVGPIIRNVYASGFQNRGLGGSVLHPGVFYAIRLAFQTQDLDSMLNPLESTIGYYRDFIQCLP